MRIKSNSFLILYFVGTITVAKASPKIILKGSELRQIVVDLIHAEVSSHLHTISIPANPIPSEIEHRLLEIQRSLDENARKTEQLIQNYEETLKQTKRHCGEVNRLMGAEGATGGSHGNVTLREQVLRMSTDLESIKEKLDIIQVNLLSGQEPSTQASPSMETSARPELLTTAYTTPRDDSLTTRNPRVGSRSLSVEASAYMETSTVPEYSNTGTTPVESDTTTSTPGGKLSPDEFEEVIRSQPAPSQGISYNGSSVDVIDAEAAGRGDGGRHMTVEFVNYLNRSMKDFELYQAIPVAFHYAPKFVPPNTKEIFSFIEPSCCRQAVAFSYRIPNTDVRLAAKMRLVGSNNSLSMAFIEEETSMENYYEDSKGIPGSSEYFNHTPSGSTRVFVVAYDNLLARANLTMVRDFTGSLKIELIQVT